MNKVNETQALTTGSSDVVGQTQQPSTMAQGERWWDGNLARYPLGLGSRPCGRQPFPPSFHPLHGWVLTPTTALVDFLLPHNYF